MLKFIRFDNEYKAYENTRKALIASLKGEQRVRYKRNSIANKLLVALMFVLWGVGIGFTLYLSFSIPKDVNGALGILFKILKFVVLIVGIVASISLGSILVVKIQKKYIHLQLPQGDKLLYHSACQYLREYYRFSQPFIITKCYECNNENFSKHDVCLFFVENELRICADIWTGFKHGYKDLGCYIIKMDELKYGYVTQEEHKRATEIEVGSLKMVLGARAKRFIDLRGITAKKSK